MATGTKKKEKEEHELTGQDLADILAGTLELLQDNGLRIALKSVPQKDDRPAGIMVYVSEFVIDESGNLREGLGG